MATLTRDAIVSVLGPVDEHVVVAVAATQATLEELIQAWAWVHADEALINEGRALPNGRVAELVDLLAPEEDEP